MQYANSLSLGDKESVIISTVITPVNASRSRERSKHCQSSQESFAHWSLNAALIGEEHGSNNYVSREDWMYCWESVLGVGIEYYGRMLEKGWIIYHICMITCIAR